MVTSLVQVTGEVHGVIAEPTDFDLFYRSEYDRLVRVAYALCGRLDVAEELTQDAMMKVYTRWSRVRSFDAPGAFARRVVVNNALSALRRRKAETKALLRFRGSTSGQATVDPDVDDFWRLVRTLPARQAQVVALYYGDEQTTAEIAMALEIAEGTVRATLAQARAALRTQVMEDNNV